MQREVALGEALQGRRIRWRFRTHVYLANAQGTIVQTRVRLLNPDAVGRFAAEDDLLVVIQLVHNLTTEFRAGKDFERRHKCIVTTSHVCQDDVHEFCVDRGDCHVKVDIATRFSAVCARVSMARRRCTVCGFLVKQLLRTQVWESARSRSSCQAFLETPGHLCVGRDRSTRRTRRVWWNRRGSGGGQLAHNQLADAEIRRPTHASKCDGCFLWSQHTSKVILLSRRRGGVLSCAKRLKVTSAGTRVDLKGRQETGLCLVPHDILDPQSHAS